MQFFFNKKTTQMDIAPVTKVSYSFCETVTAGSSTPWHIRELTARGKMLGGGADTPALCGVKVSWDLSTPFTISLAKCAALYRQKESQ